MATKLAYTSAESEGGAHGGVIHDEADGVVRVSMLHYNTEEEARRVVAALEEIGQSA